MLALAFVPVAIIVGIIAFACLNVKFKVSLHNNYCCCVVVVAVVALVVSSDLPIFGLRTPINVFPL